MQVITDAMTLVDTMDGMPVGGQVETFVVIEGGQEIGQLGGGAGLAGACALRPDRPRGVLPGEGRLHPGGQADLLGLRGAGRVPGLRAGARRALRHLGRALRAGAPPPASSRGLTTGYAGATVDGVGLDVQVLRHLLHEHLVQQVGQVGAAAGPRFPAAAGRARSAARDGWPSGSRPAGTSWASGTPTSASTPAPHTTSSGEVSSDLRHVVDGQVEVGQLRAPAQLDRLERFQHHARRTSPRGCGWRAATAGRAARATRGRVDPAAGRAAQRPAAVVTSRSYGPAAASSGRIARVVRDTPRRRRHAGAKCLGAIRPPRAPEVPAGGRPSARRGAAVAGRAAR